MHAQLVNAVYSFLSMEDTSSNIMIICIHEISVYEWLHVVFKVFSFILNAHIFKQTFQTTLMGLEICI